MDTEGTSFRYEEDGTVESRKWIAEVLYDSFVGLVKSAQGRQAG